MVFGLIFHDLFHIIGFDSIKYHYKTKKVN